MSLVQYPGEQRQQWISWLAAATRWISWLAAATWRVSWPASATWLPAATASRISWISYHLNYQLANSHQLTSQLVSSCHVAVCQVSTCRQMDYCSAASRQTGCLERGHLVSCFIAPCQQRPHLGQSFNWRVSRIKETESQVAPAVSLAKTD